MARQQTCDKPLYVRRQAIIWTNDELVYWRIYSSLGLNDMTQIKGNVSHLNAGRYSRNTGHLELFRDFEWKKLYDMVLSLCHISFAMQEYVSCEVLDVNVVLTFCNVISGSPYGMTLL